MIQCRELVPQAYQDSRDYQVLLKLLDLVVVASKADSDNFINLINPDKCPDKMLPYLASYVGYNYDYNETYDANRVIIKYFNQLIRNRGNRVGILLACTLAINAIGEKHDVELLSSFRVEYEKETNTVNIFVYYKNYLRKMRELLEVVRPIGTRIRLIPADAINTVDKINIHDYVNVAKSDYSRKNYNVDSDNSIGFGEIANNEKG